MTEPEVIEDEIESEEGGGKPTGDDPEMANFLAAPFRRYLIIQALSTVALFLILFFDDFLRLTGIESIGDFEEYRLTLKILAFLFIFICNLYVFHKTLTEIKLLMGMLEICSRCKKVRVGGKWRHIEDYIEKRSHAVFSHGICAECARELYGEEYADGL